MTTTDEELKQIPPNVIVDLYNIYQLPLSIFESTQVKSDDIYSNLDSLFLQNELTNADHKLSQQEKSQIMLGLLKFQKEDGGFSNTDEQSSISATLIAAKIINTFNLSYNVAKMSDYIDNQEISSKKNQNLKEYGALIISKRLINNLGGNNENGANDTFGGN